MNNDAFFQFLSIITMEPGPTRSPIHIAISLSLSVYICWAGAVTLLF